jgi:hypothetical protein
VHLTIHPQLPREADAVLERAAKAVESMKAATAGIGSAVGAVVSANQVLYQR